MSNTIVCIGDSLVYGKNWLNGSDLNQTLNVRLAQKYPGLSVVNLGTNGNFSSDVDTRKASVDVYQPFRVIVWVGINDVAFSVSAATIETNLQSIYTYYKSKGYEVWAITITPQDNCNGTMNTVRDTVNVWMKNTALNVDKVIDAWTAVRDPNDTAKRLSIYADPNTYNHINDSGFSVIVNLFP